jgi:hypothetical protein
MAREASKCSVLGATLSLLPCVAPAEFDAGFVHLVFNVLSSSQSAAARVSVSCSTRLAPRMTEVMAGFASTQTVSGIDEVNPGPGRFIEHSMSFFFICLLSEGSSSEDHARIRQAGLTKFRELHKDSLPLVGKINDDSHHY